VTRHAWVRPVAATLEACALTWRERAPIDVDRARAQHASYVGALRTLGFVVHELPARDDLPDSVFVEDTAVVFAGGAVVCRPGAPSRRAETEAVHGALRAHMRVWSLDPDGGTLDGGDVLARGPTWYVGAGGRSDAHDALAAIVGRWGIQVVPTPFSGCLHLKSAASDLGRGRLLVDPAHVDPASLGGGSVVGIDPDEPDAANVLRVGRDLVIARRGFPGTKARLERAGLQVIEVELDELAKAEGAVTCCSLLSG
jgi:dimethylargininase